jgi:3-phenylpropionate/trans-cinnamate dioxygenase ferredoxin subunit
MVGQFTKICLVDEIEEDSSRSFEVGDRQIVVANYEGEFYAFDNVCTHDGGILGQGKIYDRQIECPRHGARFDIKTGEATQMPAVTEIETFELKVENDTIFVAVPDQ